MNANDRIAAGAGWQEVRINRNAARAAALSSGRNRNENSRIYLQTRSQGIHQTGIQELPLRDMRKDASPLESPEDFQRWKWEAIVRSYQIREEPVCEIPKPCANPTCHYDAEPGQKYCVECEQMREEARQEAFEGWQ